MLVYTMYQKLKQQVTSFCDIYAINFTDSKEMWANSTEKWKKEKVHLINPLSFKDDFQSIMCTLKTLFEFFFIHVRNHKM